MYHGKLEDDSLARTSWGTGNKAQNSVLTKVFLNRIKARSTYSTNLSKYIFNSFAIVEEVKILLKWCQKPKGVVYLNSYLTTKLLSVLKTSWNTRDWMKLNQLKLKAPWNCVGMDPPTDFSLTSPQAGQSVSSSVTSNEPVVLTRNMPMYGIFVRIFILEE